MNEGPGPEYSPASGAAVALGTLTPAEARRRLILVVDDDHVLLRMLEVGLTRQGYPVLTAGSVPEALERLRTHSFALVLSDYNLPGGTGLDILEFLTRVRPDLPLILMTGEDEAPLARRAISTGAVDFVGKPFEFRQLNRLLEQTWARLERDADRAAQRTHEVLSGTIRALVAAVDAKDPHTARHSERVSQIAVQIGEAARLPEERLSVLEFAALLHDIGKIGVPEQILTKPGPLDTEEWELLKQHPARGAEIVAQVGELAEVASIVRHHHERVDGGGYPDGLAGEAIPLLSRILTIADAYEAMTADRSYRRALTDDEARRIIRSGLGHQFDVELGELFLRLTPIP